MRGRCRESNNAPVAQLDRVAGFEPVGWRFESSRAHGLVRKPTGRRIAASRFFATVSSEAILACELREGRSSAHGRCGSGVRFVRQCCPTPLFPRLLSGDGREIPAMPFLPKCRSLWADRQSSGWRIDMNASWGMETFPTVFIRFLPSFCFSSSFRLRVISPP